MAEVKKKVKKTSKEAEGKKAIKPKREKEAIKTKEEKEPIKPEVESTYKEKELAEEGDEKTPERTRKPDRYFEGVGRRKTSVARVRLFTRAGDFVVNGKPYGEYFPTLDLQKVAEDSLQKMKLLGRFRVSAKIRGGGSHSQAEALRHGLARCLIKFNPDFRKRLKRAGYLKRDPRMKERKKFGLKRARKAPQWAKR